MYAMSNTMQYNKQKKPLLTKKQIAEIHWLNNLRKKDAIRVGKYKAYWILSKNEPDSHILVYDQAEWTAFINGVNNHEFDDFIEE